MHSLEKLLTMQEAADALGITRKTLLAHIRQGRIAYIDVGHGLERESRRFRPSDIAAFVQSQRRTCQPASPAAGRKRRSISSTGSEEFDMRALLAKRRGIRGLLEQQKEEGRKAAPR